MTEFESALWERQHMEEMRKKGFELRNRQNPLGKTSKRTFDKWKKHWNDLDKDFNPCKYFIK